MKVLQLSKFYPPELGGIETAAFELTEGLNGQGVPTDVLCANTARGTVNDLINGYHVRRSGSLGTVLSTSMTPLLPMHLAAARGAYDILHVHLPNPLANLALWLTGWPGKVVLHWHSDIIHQERALRLYRPLQEWMLRRADAIITTSPPYGQYSPWLQPWMHKVVPVPLGIKPDRRHIEPAELARARERIQNRHQQHPIVFSIGRMAAYKGFEHLIDAARHLPEDVHVVIGGAGELLETHRQRIERMGLSHRVFMPGRLDDADAKAYLGRACAFCLPSTNRAEAFGMVLLEAMEASCPIVATDIPGSGVPWVNAHGTTGWNVRPCDPRALAEALNRLLADPAEAERMGHSGRARLLERFTAACMVKDTLAVYQSAVQGQFCSANQASFKAQ